MAFSPDQRVRGYEHPLARRVIARSFALGYALLAAAGAAPAAWGIAAAMQETGDWSNAPVWAFAALFLSAFQLAYAVYIAQLVDWAALQMAGFAALLLAIAYAFVAGLIFWEPQRAGLVETLEIEPLTLRYARAWCFVMACLLGLAAYLAGRESAHWRRDFERARAVAAMRRR